MKTNCLITLFAWFLFTHVSAQLKVNIGVDTTTQKSKLVMPFLNKYLADFTEDNEVNYADYFNPSEIKDLEYPDKAAFGLIGDYTNYYLGVPHVMALDVKSDTVKAKILFAETDSLKNITVNFIANYYLKTTKDSCRFLVTQHMETKNWQTKTIRNVTFHYPPYHRFNRKKARDLINSIVYLEKNWGLKPINIHYFFAKTNREIQAIKGFDYSFYMAKSEYPGGLAYEKEKSIFCWGKGENYFHEFVHLYLNAVYPETPLKEGIATYYGGSLGKTYQQDLIRLNTYVESRPQIDISDVATFYYMDEETNPQYAVQALICALVYEKKGVAGLKELLSHTTWDDVYKKEFNVEPEDRNRFLREQLKKYVSDMRQGK